jgi:hypothetical protein
MPLPDPPFFEHILFESPWPLVAALGLVGIVLLIHGTRRGNRRIVLAAAACIVLAACVPALSALVTTTREHLIERTRQLVAATAPLDLARVRGFVAPGAELVGPDGSPWLTADDIFRELSSATQRFAIAAQDTSRLAAEEQTPDRGRTSVHVRTTFGGQSRPSPIVTDWIFTWARQADGSWRVTRLQWMKLEGSPPPMGVWR